MPNDSATHAAPPFDRELQPVLDSRAVPAASDIEAMVALRSPTPVEQFDAQLDALGLVRQDRMVPGQAGGADVPVSVIRRAGHTPGGPGIFFVHGGGMVMGDRFAGLDRYAHWIDRFDAVAVTVEYRLAPEHPAPAPVDDTYAALCWTRTHAGELGFDTERLIAVGLSAGAGLLAASMLLARDNGVPLPAAQVLLAPMLDDRNATTSSRQIQGIGIWDRASNVVGWDAFLAGHSGAADVSPYAAPARAEDLSGLPPTFIDCGSAEVFRDEAVAYASRIWAAGGSADLHVWAGGFHGFDGFVPDAKIAVAAREARTAFLERILG